MSFRLRFENEDVPKEHEHFKIFPYQVATLKRKHETELVHSPLSLLFPFISLIFFFLPSG